MKGWGLVALLSLSLLSLAIPSLASAQGAGKKKQGVECKDGSHQPGCEKQTREAPPEPVKGPAPAPKTSDLPKGPGYSDGQLDPRQVGLRKAIEEKLAAMKELIERSPKSDPSLPGYLAQYGDDLY